MNELAKQWPDGAQIEIFQTVLDEWPAFMSQVHIEERDPKGRYYKWAVPSLINKFRHIGLELYIAKKQAAQKPLPHSVVALNPKLYNPKAYKPLKPA